MVIAFNKQHQGKRNPDGRLAGILIEAKDSQMYRDLYNREIGEDILNLLSRLFHYFSGLLLGFCQNFRVIIFRSCAIWVFEFRWINKILKYTNESDSRAHKTKGRKEATHLAHSQVKTMPSIGQYGLNAAKFSEIQNAIEVGPLSGLL